MTKEYKRALDYYQEVLRASEKVLGKTHADTLSTTMNIAMAFGDGLVERVKEEEMQRRALAGYEKSLGKDHEDTKKCARNLAILLAKELIDKTKDRELEKRYPHLLTETRCVPGLLRGEGK